MITFFNYHPVLINTPKISRIFLFFFFYISSISIVLYNGGEIQWHCGPSLAHEPEFDTFDVALTSLSYPVTGGIKCERHQGHVDYIYQRAYNLTS